MPATLSCFKADAISYCNIYKLQTRRPISQHVVGKILHGVSISEGSYHSYGKSNLTVLCTVKFKIMATNLYNSVANTVEGNKITELLLKCLFCFINFKTTADLKPLCSSNETGGL